jgi:hypothetical protein
MRVYHGSFLTIKEPCIRFSRTNLDFGRGFYLTSFVDQAERWARRKAVRKSGSPIINVYELSEAIEGANVLSFLDDESWVEFVCACRRGEPVDSDYDLIIGNVADDQVFTVVEMYYKGLWNMHRTIKELKYYHANDQICLKTQAAIATCFHSLSHTR